MDRESGKYEGPSQELYYLELAKVLVSSTLENPEEGEDWSWD